MERLRYGTEYHDDYDNDYDNSGRVQLQYQEKHEEAYEPEFDLDPDSEHLQYEEKRHTSPNLTWTPTPNTGRMTTEPAHRTPWTTRSTSPSMPNPKQSAWRPTSNGGTTPALPRRERRGIRRTPESSRRPSS